MRTPALSGLTVGVILLASLVSAGSARADHVQDLDRDVPWGVSRTRLHPQHRRADVR